MFSSNTTQVSESGPDAQFNYVTMLLHGDGTNGAQNNTFVDSSTNNFTITRNGNTTQGSFSPYGSNWSNYFDGSGDYLSIPSNAAFAFGTGDFTVEGWIFYSSVASNAVRIMATAGAAANCLVQVNTSSQIDFYDGVTTTTFTAATTSANTWTHIAVTRSGTSLRAFINGTQVGSAVTNTTSILSTQAINFPATTNYASTSCYLSNVRYVKGTAVYTSSFTPSTTPLTAISGTSLLTCQSNRFIENSANNFAVTVNGDTSVQRFNPFGTATAYSTSVIGGSMYSDGNGDILSIADNAALQWGTGDFCVEMWINPPNVSGSKTLVCKGTNNAGTFELDLQANKIEMYTAAFVFTSSASIVANAWTHVAVTRSGTTLRLFINGVLDTTVTSYSYDFNNTGTFYIGVYGNGGSNQYSGYLSDVRCVKGSAVYTSAFTPPTAPLTAITNTQLLTNFTNGAIFDNAMMNDLETVGNAQISTSVKKYGTGSLAFDGTGDGLVYNASPNFVFGTGNFTVEFWLYLNANQANFTKYFTTGSGANGLTIGQQSAANVICIDDTSNVILTASSSVANTTWTHIALVRSGTTLTLYYNGTSVGSVSNSTNWTAGIGSVGSNNGGTQSVNGYIDDLRVTKGYARYTANFTAPTAAFSDTGPI